MPKAPTLEDRVTALEKDIEQMRAILFDSPITQTQAAKFLNRSPSFVSKRRSRPEYHAAFTGSGAVWLSKFRELLEVHG